ncbi:hypothetical protein BHM03_00016422 [Ensete ventricosum]|nr:hypothetical protein BHM03_00016422 [Ensete ventricosum]
MMAGNGIQKMEAAKATKANKAKQNEGLLLLHSPFISLRDSLIVRAVHATGKEGEVSGKAATPASQAQSLPATLSPPLSFKINPSPLPTLNSTTTYLPISGGGVHKTPTFGSPVTATLTPRQLPILVVGKTSLTIGEMGWRRNQHHQQRQEQERRKQEENNTKKKKKKLTSTSSSFSFSSVLPFSWLANKLKKPKRRTAPVTVPPGAVFTPPPSPSPPDPQLDRLSTGEDGGGSRPRITPAAARQRIARHHSVGDLEITLGHIIPFSRRSTRRWVESDSGSDASGCDLGLGRRPPRPRRGTVGYTSDRRVDPDGRDGLPRRSFSGKIRHRARVRVRSPRAAAAKAEVERIKAAARRAEGKRKGLERFAVVKCSRDPQRDFRESMVEMIWQKGIGRPEEMESLLACYLSLNSDEHHDVIVKVFRQVWFELNQSPIDGTDGSRDRC